MLVDRIGEGEPIVIEKRKKNHAAERMRQLMEEDASKEAQMK